MKHLLITLAAVVTLAGCATTPGGPEWLRDAPALHSECSKFDHVMTGCINIAREIENGKTAAAEAKAQAAYDAAYKAALEDSEHGK